MKRWSPTPNPGPGVQNPYPNELNHYEPTYGVQLRHPYPENCDKDPEKTLAGRSPHTKYHAKT